MMEGIHNKGDRERERERERGREKNNCPLSFFGIRRIMNKHTILNFLNAKSIAMIVQLMPV